jgi:hypothetical protein
MALQDNDLLVVQKPSTKLHYKVKVSDLIPDAVDTEFPMNLVHVGENPPADPHEGSLWFKPNGDAVNNGVLYLYYVTPTTGTVTGVTIRGGGSGYQQDSILYPSFGSGHELALKVTAVDGIGKVTDVEITNAGHGYEIGDTVYVYDAGHSNASFTVRDVSSTPDGEWLSLMDGGEY